jgi:putative acyl-CoA dehydrogenase
MATVERHGAAPFVTHEVANQPPPLEGHDLFAANRPLAEGVAREGAGWAAGRLSALGRAAGAPATLRAAELAHRHVPVLRTHDRYGHRIDEVEYHRAWHEVMALAVGHAAHALPWREPRPGAHVARAAAFMLLTQVEPGHGCPISMTYAAVPALRAEPALAAEWEPRLTSLRYDPGLRPAADKAGALCGMAMTEKQGGSDVRANTTRALPLDEDGAYELVGHKWFCSAPMCDLFLVLAQAPGGLSCFALPRVLPDGTRNAFHLQRLKDKLGNRSNASSEVELHGAWAQLVGEEGRGVRTIVEMVNHTRLDCVLGTTAGMRQAVEEAVHHAAHRAAFGRLLVDQPLMVNVLADLCVEAEAATALALRLARAYDDPGEAAFRRLVTAVGKYWVCKRGPGHAAEALECLGGAGYIEEWPMPRRYREQPLMSIWEGSGNVQCLDVLRAVARTPEALEAVLAEVDASRGADRRLDAFAAGLRDAWTDPATLESRARRVVEQLALALQGALLVRHAPPAVADAFCASRLAGEGGREYGTLPAGVDARAIVERHRPPA